MKPWVYTLLFLPGALLATGLSGSTPGYINWPIVPPTLAMALFVYSAWTNLDPEIRRPKPLLAAVLLFVPILNIFWMYKVIYPLGRRIKDDVDKYDLKEEVGDAFSRVYCHLQIVVLPLVIGTFVAWGMRMPGTPSSSFLPIAVLAGVVLLMWLVVLHVMFFHYSSLINAISDRRRRKNAEPAA